jgi:hypothetical protein
MKWKRGMESLRKGAYDSDLPPTKQLVRVDLNEAVNSPYDEQTNVPETWNPSAHIQEHGGQYARHFGEDMGKRDPVLEDDAGFVGSLETYANLAFTGPDWLLQQFCTPYSSAVCSCGAM